MKNLIPALVCLFLVIPCQAGVIYVDANAPPAGDGTSWETTHKYLQGALDNAESDDEIWVAVGIYRPDDDDANHPDSIGLRAYTLQSIDGVAIYGGFPSGGVTWQQRDPNAVRIDGDYHLKNKGWWWDSDAHEWTLDNVTSKCIDASNPGSPLADEPIILDVDPLNILGENIRINTGAYGGTAEASMQPYDWLLLADLTNDGTVNFEGFASQANDWFESVSKQPGVLHHNGMVDIADLTLLKEDWLEQNSLAHTTIRYNSYLRY